MAALSYIPFAYVMNYTSIVDAAFAKWMSDHAQDFILEPETGFFIYNGKHLSVSKLQREFWPLAVSAVFEVFDWIRTTDKENAAYYLFIVNPREYGSSPADDGLVSSKWKFNEESDIKLNFPLFEEAFQKVFDRLFKLQTKNKNKDILYIQVEDLAYNRVLNDVIGRLFGMTRMTDLSEKFAPRHLHDARSDTDAVGVATGDLSAVENSISATLEWVEQMTSLSARI